MDLSFALIGRTGPMVSSRVWIGVATCPLNVGLCFKKKVKKEDKVCPSLRKCIKGHFVQDKG
jgi:hypothetical protein